MQFVADNKEDTNGHITGGSVMGVAGIEIHWQDGLIGATGRSGALVEDVLWAALQRLQAFQETDLRCRENALAITKIEEAMHWLSARTQDRIARGVAHSYQS